MLDKAKTQRFTDIIRTMKEKPLICTSIVQSDKVSILADLERAKNEGSDLAELRIDFLTDKSVDTIKSIISQSPLPLIVTNRNKEDGGRFPSGNENVRLQLLNSAIELRPAFVDIELHTNESDRSAILKNARKNGVGVICSYHDFKQTPKQNQIIKFYEDIAKTGADVAKLVFTVNKKDDVQTIILATKQLSGEQMPFTLFGMGQTGQSSRLLCPMIGACMTYCALEPDLNNKLGQVSVKDTKRLFNLIERSKGWEGIKKVAGDIMVLSAMEFASNSPFRSIENLFTIAERAILLKLIESQMCRIENNTSGGVNQKWIELSRLSTKITDLTK